MATRPPPKGKNSMLAKAGSSLEERGPKLEHFTLHRTTGQPGGVGGRRPPTRKARPPPDPTTVELAAMPVAVSHYAQHAPKEKPQKEVKEREKEERPPPKPVVQEVYKSELKNVGSKVVLKVFLDATSFKTLAITLPCSIYSLYEQMCAKCKGLEGIVPSECTLYEANENTTIRALKAQEDLASVMDCWPKSGNYRFIFKKAPPEERLVKPIEQSPVKPVEQSPPLPAAPAKEEPQSGSVFDSLPTSQRAPFPSQQVKTETPPNLEPQKSTGSIFDSLPTSQRAPFPSQQVKSEPPPNLEPQKSTGSIFDQLPTSQRAPFPSQVKTEPSPKLEPQKSTGSVLDQLPTSQRAPFPSTKSESLAEIPQSTTTPTSSASPMTLATPPPKRPPPPARTGSSPLIMATPPQKRAPSPLVSSGSGSNLSSITQSQPTTTATPQPNSQPQSKAPPTQTPLSNREPPTSSAEISSPPVKQRPLSQRPPSQNPLETPASPPPKRAPPSAPQGKSAGAPGGRPLPRPKMGGSMPKPPPRTMPKAAAGVLHESDLDEADKADNTPTEPKPEPPKPLDMEIPAVLPKPPTEGDHAKEAEDVPSKSDKPAPLQKSFSVASWSKTAKPHENKRMSSFGFLAVSHKEQAAVHAQAEKRRESIMMGARTKQPPAAEEKPKEQAILRFHYPDGTFRSIMVTSATTAAEVREQLVAKMLAENPALNLSDHAVFESVNNKERELDPKELPLSVSKGWSGNASKFLFKDKKEKPKGPTKEILRVYFSDYTFKTFALDSTASVKDLCAQINRKMRFPDADSYSLWETSDTRDAVKLNPDDIVSAIKEYAEEAIVDIKFVYSNTKPQSFQKFRDEERARLEKEIMEQKRASTMDFAQDRSSVYDPRASLMTTYTGGDSRALMAQAMKNSSGIQVKSKEEREHNQKMQLKAFTAWVNYHLAKRGLCVENLRTDLQSGVMLINLLEILSGESLGRYTKQPKVMLQQIDNINFALKFCKAKGIPNNNCSAEDLYDGNIKLILSFLWPLVVASYTGELIYVDESDAKKDLLSWCKECIEESGRQINIPVDNFDVSWRDGRLICLLLSSYYSDVFDYDNLSQGNCLKDTLEIAERELQIPIIIAEEDMVTCKRKEWKPDDRSVFCLVAAVYDVLRLCCTPTE